MTMLRLPTKEEKLAAVETAYEKLSDEEKKDIDTIAARFIEGLRVKKGVGSTGAVGIGHTSMKYALGIIAMYLIVYEIPLGEDPRLKEKEFWKVPPTQVYR